MTQTSTPLGRPTFRIDGPRLWALRKEAGLTQLGLGQKVYVRAGKGRTRAVPLDMAKYIAQELNTTVDVLVGSAPEPAPSLVDEIERRISAQITDGPSPTLAAALETCRDEAQPERELAMRLNSRLEAAQLSHAKDEFEVLSALTGFSTAGLRQPMSHDRFWSAISTGPSGPERTEVVSGVAEILHAVRTELQTCVADAYESDAHVSFMKERHWFIVTFAHARLPQLARTLRFVRCQPNETGLSWTSPT